ncbi:MAG: hypothetical protein AB7I27_19440 [Bacteriovoracaceae bacterium]
MNEKITIKSSSRSGRFKKKLVSEDLLKIEAPIIKNKLAPLLELYSSNKITQAEFCALYLITILSYRFPGTWIGAKRPPLGLSHQLHFLIKDIPFDFEENISSRLSQCSTIGDLLNQFALKSTPETVNRSLLMWSNQSYHLKLLFYIPLPAEVLEQQMSGKRCVTTLIQEDELSEYILGERDSLSFTMHDLIHADHFYHHNDCYQGQLGFYGLLAHTLKSKYLDSLLANKKFKHEFEYLISDMNAYAIHLLKCLKSAIIHYHPEKEFFFLRWLDQLNLDSSELSCFKGLNTQEYRPETDDVVLLKFLDKWRKAL